MTVNNDVITYRIDNNDRITYIGGVWDSFAQENGGKNATVNNILGRSLWDFLEGEDVKRVYRLIVDEIRNKGKLKFSFRCDSPEFQRFYDLHCTKLANGEIEFASIPAGITARQTEVTDPHDPITDALLVACSWCKRIRWPKVGWAETSGIPEFKAIFGEGHSRPLTHGICDDCYGSVLTQIRNPNGFATT